ncbi:DUF192 domain-containing protein [Acetivibrio cellulolyticus]|uniref:DUF192 domain-containing protein n=1 Tax=Acetivibrio cellulolyticus TaxID=35830 RepID=UPI0001E300E5|nr:DUF192 domain-containing protein [Acetivibrio cellulolyticus]
MIVKNVTKSSILSDDLSVANTFFKRFMGLMFKQELPHGKGLHIVPCNSIHMCFMNFPLDIIFLSKDMEIISIIEGIKPWKVSPIISKSYSVLELPFGTIAQTNSSIGDELVILPL